MICVTTTGLRGGARKKIEGLVAEMEWLYTKALTGDVTHLVAGAPGSAKYKVAVEAGLAVVTPDWVEACRQMHATGQPAPLESSFAVERSPPEVVPPTENVATPAPVPILWPADTHAAFQQALRQHGRRWEIVGAACGVNAADAEAHFHSVKAQIKQAEVAQLNIDT
jgi:hypothetical protein